jgi:CHAD domain-containing protein
VVTFFDTFDWRLFRDGSALFAVKTDGGPLLTWTEWDGRPRLRLQAGATPAFAWDLPGGTFRERISKVIEMRRLLPLVEIERTERELSILDSYEKTVARVVLERSAIIDGRGPKTGGLPTILSVAPLRGYDAAHARVIRIVEDELGLPPLDSTALELVLAAIGRRPGDYSSKLSLSLSPRTRADDATKTVHRRLLEVLLANEDGTRRGLDSEFLHDFRVSVRRTRSALGQVKQIFPEQRVHRFGKEFAWLGGVTGPVRDLDVHLLRMQEYRAALPEADRTGLQPLSDFLRRRHREEQRRLAAALRSQRYRELIRQWQRFLEEPDDDDVPPNASRPIIEVASERVWRVWCRTRKRGLAIDDESPPSSLHRLRIECKKLRYLMEFYRSLYDAEAVGELIRALKGLQDNLGDLNDLAIQQETLRRSAKEMSDDGLGDVNTFIVIGRLVEQLACRQVKQRRRFASRFATFAAAKNRLCFSRLFEPRRSGT